MASTLFAEVLKSSLDVPAINRYFVEDRDKTLKVLSSVRPEGRVDGNRFKLASVEGGAGKSWDYNLQNGSWGDWAAGTSYHGIVGFLEQTLHCSTAQAVDWLVSKKHLQQREAKKALADSEGDPLVFPIPDDKQDWEVVIAAEALRRERGIIKNHWTIRDLDGTLLGYKFRVDSRNTSKEVYTVTYRAEQGWVKKAWQKGLIPPYGLEDLRDGPTVRVLFVEGEKARDRAKELLGHRWKVLSFSGIKASDDLWLPEEFEDCEILLWPDNDAPGKEAARKIALALQKLTGKPREIRQVRVDRIADIGKGWDIGDWEEGCGVNLEAELERAESLDTFEAISREWVYVAQEDKFYNLEDRQIILTPASFDRSYMRFATKFGNASKIFLSSIENQQAVDLDFLPGYDTFIETPGGKLLLNEWYPSETLARGKELAENSDITDEEIEEKAQHFIAHLGRIAGDEVVEPEKDQDGMIIARTEGRLLRDALAFYFSRLVQRPMDRQGWIPILVSEHNGTGKSYFRRMIAAIIGGTRTQELTVGQYTSEYEDWMDGCLFYELNEAKSQNTAELYELLKKNHQYIPFDINSLRDRGQGVRQVNIKGSKQKKQRNFLNGMITSNDLFPIALANSSGLEGSDRRLLAINCEEIISEATADLMFEELTQRPEWIAAWLFRYVSPYSWNPGWAPVTKHKRLMLEKDRERTESKQDKTELGRYDEFYHAVQWALNERIGAMRKRVITPHEIRLICENHKVKFPWDATRFDRLVQKAGLIRAPKEIETQLQERLYATTEDMLKEGHREWIKAQGDPINDPTPRNKKKSEKSDLDNDDPMGAM